MAVTPAWSRFLALEADLLRATRLRSLATPERPGLLATEIAILSLSGATAATLTHVLRLPLGIPGSSIAFAVFPLGLGLALVPRRGAGTAMAGAALVTSMALGLAGGHLAGLGATTSLLLTGPLLDIALRLARGGWRLYGAFVGACVASNTLAFVARASGKLWGLGGGGGGRPFEAWLPQAVWTYAAAGVAAGLLSAGTWFHWRERDLHRP